MKFLIASAYPRKWSRKNNRVGKNVNDITHDYSSLQSLIRTKGYGEVYQEVRKGTRLKRRVIEALIPTNQEFSTKDIAALLNNEYTAHDVCKVIQQLRVEGNNITSSTTRCGHFKMYTWHKAHNLSK